MTGNDPAEPGAREELCPERLRHTLGRFATGITVVTSVSGEADSLVAHGMTANAFCAVSLEPPLVLVSIASGAATHRRIAATGRYGVSLLSAEQEPLSQHFAGGRQRPDLVSFVWRDGLPLLDGALAQFSCRVRQAHPAGDHTVFIGEIERLECGPGDPLVHYARQLFRLGARPRDGRTENDPRGTEGLTHVS